MKTLYTLPLLLFTMTGCAMDHNHLPTSPNFSYASLETKDHGRLMTSPVYSLTPQNLAEQFIAHCLSYPRVSIDKPLNEALKVTLIQKSAVLRFKDTIELSFIEAHNQGASFIWFSSSNLGYYDFGVNEARMRKWIGEFEPA